MSSSTVAFTGIPVKTVNPRVTNPDPFVNTYRDELEKATIRKQRFLQSRAQAKLVENQVQERYRAAMIANVEKELFRRKAQYEEQKQAQLDALRKVYAQSMRMLGQAQKVAINVTTADTEQALNHAKVWETLAEASLQRGKTAVQEENLVTSQSLYTNDEQIYRTEVMKAAALHHRRNARRLSSASTTTSTHIHSYSDRYGHPVVHQPPRDSPFYGPYGIQETNHLVTKDTIVSSTLQRVNQKGPVSETSVIRVPVLTMKTTEEYKHNEENGFNAGQRTAEEFEQQRIQAGKEARIRERQASRRGSSAGRQLREQREGMHLLQELERLDSENRVLSIQNDQYNQQLYQQYQQQRRLSVPSSVSSSGLSSKPKEELLSTIPKNEIPATVEEETSISLLAAVRDVRRSSNLLSKEYEHHLEDVQRPDDEGELAEQLIEEEFTKAQHLETDLKHAQSILQNENDRTERINEGKRTILLNDGNTGSRIPNGTTTDNNNDGPINSDDRSNSIITDVKKNKDRTYSMNLQSTVPRSFNHPLLYQPYTVPNEEQLVTAFEDTLVGDLLMQNSTKEE